MTLLSKRLEMVFLTLQDKKVTMSISNPKNTLSKAEVETAMDTIVAKNIFNFGGSQLKEKVAARINTLEEVE